MYNAFNIGCKAGEFYKLSTGECNTECGCGEGQVKNYKDPNTDATYDACVPGEHCMETFTDSSTNCTDGSHI